MHAPKLILSRPSMSGMHPCVLTRASSPRIHVAASAPDHCGEVGQKLPMALARETGEGMEQVILGAECNSDRSISVMIHSSSSSLLLNTLLNFAGDVNDVEDKENEPPLPKLEDPAATQVEVEA